MASIVGEDCSAEETAATKQRTTAFSSRACFGTFVLHASLGPEVVIQRFFQAYFSTLQKEGKMSRFADTQSRKRNDSMVRDKREIQQALNVLKRKTQKSHELAQLVQDLQSSTQASAKPATEAKSRRPRIQRMTYTDSQLSNKVTKPMLKERRSQSSSSSRNLRAQNKGAKRRDSDEEYDVSVLNSLDEAKQLIRSNNRLAKKTRSRGKKARPSLLKRVGSSMNVFSRRSRVIEDAIKSAEDPPPNSLKTKNDSLVTRKRAGGTSAKPQEAKKVAPPPPPKGPPPADAKKDPNWKPKQRERKISSAVRRSSIAAARRRRSIASDEKEKASSANVLPDSLPDLPKYAKQVSETASATLSGKPKYVNENPLPAGWTEMEDYNSGNLYYTSTTGETTWFRPGDTSGERYAVDFESRMKYRYNEEGRILWVNSDRIDPVFFAPGTNLRYTQSVGGTTKWLDDPTAVQPAAGQQFYDEGTGMYYTYNADGSTSWVTNNARPYAAPEVERQRSEISMKLKEYHLDQYSDHFFDVLGLAYKEEISHLEEEDLDSIGMKKLEKKRFMALKDEIMASLFTDDGSTESSSEEGEVTEKDDVTYDTNDTSADDTEEDGPEQPINVSSLIKSYEANDSRLAEAIPSYRNVNLPRAQDGEK